MTVFSKDRRDGSLQEQSPGVGVFRHAPQVAAMSNRSESFADLLIYRNTEGKLNRESSATHLLSVSAR